MTQVKNITPPANTLTILADNTLQQAKLSEAAIVISFNGISHVVMMASPAHLKDFALGFALSEGLIGSVKEVLDTVVHSHDYGWQVDIQILASSQNRLKQRRRKMTGPSGCGLCGIDSLEAAMELSYSSNIELSKNKVLPCEATIVKAKDALPIIVKKAGGTRGNHVAAYFDLSGNVMASREDVGRHSALDKLLGCLAKGIQPITEGFVLLTSRCSHDLIAKVARLNLFTLVTLAQPTDLAVNSARKAGIALFCFQYGQLKRFA
jgi:FdhD protein